MLNGGWSQAVDGTMGVHMPCPYTLAPWPSMPALHCPRQPLGQGGLEVEGQMEVVAKLCCHRAATATPQSPVGTTPGDPSLHCRGSVGAAVCSAPMGRKTYYNFDESPVVGSAWVQPEMLKKFHRLVF